jgi:hypothetical protein
MAENHTQAATSTVKKVDTIKAPRATTQRRQRSEVEAATSRVMNLIGRLSPGDQRKVMGAVSALVAKSDE